MTECQSVPSAPLLGTIVEGHEDVRTSKSCMGLAEPVESEPFEIVRDVGAR